MNIDINGYSVIIDDEDYPIMLEHNWSIWKNKKGTHIYVYCNMYDTNKLKYSMMLHRYLMDCKKGDGKDVDHINGDTLDNRRQNLRICTHKENTHNAKLSRANKSGYKGVYFSTERNKYRAGITLNGIYKHIAYANTAEEAARLYDVAAIRYYKEYARTNFPKENYIKEQ